MSTVLLKGGTVLVLGDGDRITPTRADVLIEGDRIARVEPNIAAPKGCDVLDCTNKIVSPGFIDTHHHLWEAPLKGLCGDCAFVPYMAIMYTAGQTLEPEDIFWGNLAGSMELLDAGTTTVLDHSHCNWSPSHSKQAIAGTLSAGLRSIYAYTPTLNLTEAKPKPAFSQDALPDWLMTTFEQLADSHPLGEPQSRVRLGFGFDFYHLPKETVQELFSKARSLGAGIITSHYFRPQGAQSRSLPALLKSYGYLDERVVLSHAGGATAEDAALMKSANAFVAVTPSSEQAMAVGPPVAFRDGELNMDEVCAFGVDCQSFTSASLVSEMRVGLQSARGLNSAAHQRRGTLPKAVHRTTHEAFNMGTIQGARALCMDAEVGSIAVGKKADVVVFDALSPAMAGAAQQDPVMAIVLHSGVGDIDAVLVDGQFRKRDGRLLPVTRTQWQDEGGFVETGQTLGWRDVAGSLLEVQTRFVAGLKEYDLSHMSAMVTALFHLPE